MYVVMRLAGSPSRVSGGSGPREESLEKAALSCTFTAKNFFPLPPEPSKKS